MLLQFIPFILYLSAIVVPPLVFLFHFIPWLYNFYGTRSIPGPFLAKFTDLWLALHSKNGHRSEVVHQLHLKHGSIVRIAPNHVSIADPAALPTIYGHGSGALKSDFYDAFVFMHTGLFNTRDRSEHTRKRKIISHVFSPKSILEFEPHLHHHIATLVRIWDRMYEDACRGRSGTEGEGWHGGQGYLWLNLLPWSNYLTFDITGDLSFGAPFGMLTTARDVTEIPRDQRKAMMAYGDKASTERVEVLEVPAVKTTHGRGEYSITMGCLPAYWRPLLARCLPWVRRGRADVKRLEGIAVMAVMKRLNSPPTDRVDLLSKLQEGKDNDGKPMGRDELTAEALTFMNAGSGTTSHSICAIIHQIACHPRVQGKLHAHLDERLGGMDLAGPVVTADEVKNLPYLDACINEGLRIHSTLALGLPRVVPEGGLHISGRFFPSGSIVSVPTYTIHRDKSVWGEDAESYRPERWEEAGKEQLKAMQSTFNTFSQGPRACVGKNLATLELQMILASLVRRYEFFLQDLNKPLDIRETLLRKPLRCEIGLRRRER